MWKLSVDTVKADFEAKGADIEIFELDDSGATVEEAAKTIGVPADAIAKTLALHLNEEVIILVMSGNARIDNKKYRGFFHAKARMLAHDEVEPLTGHPVGGLCPFGLRGRPPIYLDETLRKHEYVYPAAGSRYHAFKISTKQLEELTGAQWADVCSNLE